MLLLPLSLIAVFGLAHTLPLDDVESPATLSSSATSELPADDSGRVIFDQRQTGKYNIHVSIKDVAIIEVGQNELTDGAYNDAEDYYYDDSALTIKPIKFSTEGIGSSTTSSSSSSTSSSNNIVEAATTSTTAISSTSTTEAPTTFTTLKESTITSEAPLSSSNATSTYSSNLLADIAASRIRPKSRLNNLMIMETPIGGARSTALPHLPHPRSKDIPIMAAAAAVTRPTLPQGIEYTPPQGHNSPIFKVKVQRSAVPPTKKPVRCRSHQTRNAQGKCGDSIYRRLYSMLMGLNIPGLVGAPPHAAAAGLA